MKRSEKVQQRAERLVSNPNFQSDILKIRSRVEELPIKGFGNDKELEVWKEKYIYPRLNGWDVIDGLISQLLHIYNLGPTWHHSLKRYLLLNNPDDMQLPTDIQVGMKRDMEKNRWQVVMYIPEDATQSEIKEALPRVTQWQQRIPGKQKTKIQPAPLESLSKKAYETHKELGSYKKTDAALGFLPGRARDLIRNYKKQRGIN